MYTEARRKTWQLLAANEGGRSGRITDVAIMAIILTNVFAIILETVDALAAAYGPVFFWIEVVSVAIFTVEYIGRLWSCIEYPGYDRMIVDRLRFAMKPIILVDLLAIVPFFLTGFIPDMRALRALRVVRILRLFKAERYSESVNVLERVVYQKRHELVVSVVVDFIMIIILSTIIYELENELQPELFSSIPATMWWGVTMVTRAATFGEPVTVLGKLLGAILAFLGVGLLGIPGAIIAAGLMQEYSKQQRNPRGGNSA